MFSPIVWELYSFIEFPDWLVLQFTMETARLDIFFSRSREIPSSETQGQLVGAGRSKNNKRSNNFRRADFWRIFTSSRPDTLCCPGVCFFFYFCFG